MPDKLEKNGFTLIEMIIVVAIIAILAALIFVATKPLKRFQETNNAVRFAEIDSIARAIKQYQVDNFGRNPTGLDSTLRMIGTDSSGCNVDCGSTSEISYIDTGNTLNYYSNNTYTIRQQFSADNFSSLTASVVLDCDGGCSDPIIISVGGEPCDPIDASSVRTDGTTSNYTWYTTTCNVDSGSLSNPFYVQLLQYTGSGTIRFLMEESDPSGSPQFSSGGGWNNDNGDYFLKIGVPEKTNSACLDLGASLIDTYFSQVPYDPKDGSVEKTYYAIKEIGDGNIKVVACSAENNEEIQITR